MFQKILAVVDQNHRSLLQRSIPFSQCSDAKLSLLHLLKVQGESILLLLSDLERQKYWAGTELTDWNVWNDRERSLKRVRPKTKLKVAANVATLEPTVLNDQKFDRISTTDHLGRSIVEIAQLCKADLIVMSLSPTALIALPTVCLDVARMAHCSVLIVKDAESMI